MNLMGKIKKKIIIGDRIGRLVITDIIKPIKQGNQFNRAVRCVCDCGKIIDTPFNQLGHKKSCGCIKLERITKMGIAKATHRLTKHPLYIKWMDIKTRTGVINKKCLSEKTIKNYIEKGIKMCPEWENSFMSFYNWSMTNGWKKGMIIDRKINSMGYSPENCRYVTIGESNRNTSKNIYYNGLCLKDYCELNNLPYSTIYARYKYYGYTLLDAIKTPLRK